MSQAARGLRSSNRHRALAIALLPSLLLCAAAAARAAGRRPGLAGISKATLSCWHAGVLRTARRFPVTSGAPGSSRL